LSQNRKWLPSSKPRAWTQARASRRR